MRDGFVFYRSFYEAIKSLPAEQFKECATAIMEYGLNDQEPQQAEGISNAVFILVKPQIDANNKRFENGKKGGGQPGNQNARKRPKTTKNDLETTKNDQKRPKEKEKEKVKVKDKVKDKEKEKEFQEREEEQDMVRNVWGVLEVKPSKRDINALTREVMKASNI